MACVECLVHVLSGRVPAKKKAMRDGLFASNEGFLSRRHRRLCSAGRRP